MLVTDTFSLIDQLWKVKTHHKEMYKSSKTFHIQALYLLSYLSKLLLYVDSSLTRASAIMWPKTEMRGKSTTE